jgi:L-asparaginase II
MNKLIDIYRGKLVESSHNGHIAVVDSSGNLLYSYGDPYRITYARSAIKPIQAIPVVESNAVDKFNIEDREVSLMCSSHNSEEFHAECTREILNKADISLDKLQCGTHIPLSINAYKDLILKGKELTSEYSNCSGKHCGMLITAKHMNEDIDTYLDINHPVQQRILETLSKVCDYNIDEIIIGVDGCGAPVHALPLEKLAHGFARLSKPELLGEERRVAVQRITSSMTTYPEMVAGTNRFCTDFMKVCGDRMFGKLGAEGVYLVGIKEKGIGVAIKIEDGDVSVMYPVVLEVLRQLELITIEELQKLIKYYNPKILNARKEEVGEILPNFKLKEYELAY